jgi:hypothetical protein
MSEVVGKKSIDAGYVWVPYVMAENVRLGSWIAQRRMSLMSELWGFPSKEEEDNVFYPKTTVASRYAVTKVNNNFYGTIDINKKTDI